MADAVIGMPSQDFNDAFQRAVNSNPRASEERLLSGVALAAAGANEKDSDYFHAFGSVLPDSASSPVSPDTVMWLASCTKLITTVAALQCVERKLVDLHSAEDVERLLPEWNHPQILTGFNEGQAELAPAKEKITLARLLTHTNGLAYDFTPQLMRWRLSRNEKPQALTGAVDHVFQHPLLFEPGTGFTYGPGLELAGLMIARANSCSLEEYMRKNIFSVLGMDSTSFYPLRHNNIASRLMPMSTRVADDQTSSIVGGEQPGAFIKVLPLEPKDEFGGVGLFGTAADYLQLLKSLLRNDGQVLTPSSVKLMFSPAISNESQSALNGLLSDEVHASYQIPGEPLVGTEGSGEWSHGLGGILGLTSQEGGLSGPWLQFGGAPNLKWWIDPVGGTCGCFFTQLAPPGEKKHQFLTKLFQREMIARFSKK